MIVQNSALSVYYPLAQALSRNALIQSGTLNYNEPILVDEDLKSGRVHKFGIRPVEENNEGVVANCPEPLKTIGSRMPTGRPIPVRSPVVRLTPIRTKQSPQRMFATPQASDQRLAFR